MAYDMTELFGGIAFLDVQTSLVCAVVCLFWMYILLWKPSGLPPGPSWRTPLLGHLREFMQCPDLRQVLTKYRQRYGEVYSLYLGRRLVVVVNGLDAIKEAFVSRKEEFVYHPNTIVQQARSRSYGLSGVDGNTCNVWEMPTLDALKTNGLDMSAIEATIDKEVDHLQEEMNVYHDKVFSPKQLITTSLVNVNYAVALGTEYLYNDTEFRRLLSLTKKCVTAANTSGLLNFLPFLRHLPGDYFRFKEFKRLSRTLNRYFDFRIELCKENNEDWRTKVLAATYLRAMQEDKQTSSEKGVRFSEDNLKAMLGDIVGTGSENTIRILGCAIRFLAENTGIQDQIHKEIGSYVGNKRRPCLADKSHLPYTVAFIKETQRMSGLVALGPPHTTDENVDLRGHWLPKESVIFPDVQTVMFDSELWEEPEVFRPERFLSGKCLFSELVDTMPFFVGQRYKIGYELSSMELFLYVTTLVQSFEFDQPAGYDTTDVNKAGGTTVTKQSGNFTVRLRNRKRHDDWETI